MSFPQNPVDGTSYTIGSRTWYWDGGAWNLLPATTTDNDTSGPDHTHDTPKILDDLLDVEVKEPAFSETFGYYINTASDDAEGPDAANGWGRYLVDVSGKTITFNRRDLDGKDLYDIWNTITDVTTCRFLALDGSFELEAKVVSKSRNTTSITLTYDNTDTLTTLHNEGKSKLFNVIFADYKALSDGAILVYRRQNELWKPEPNPTLESGNNITIGYDPPEFPNPGDVWVDEDNFYMYVWEGDMWIALTGPEGGSGGGGIANNNQISMVSSRGLFFNDSQGGTQFNLNQPFDQYIDVQQKNITTLDYQPHAAPERGDIWVHQRTMYQYIWDGSYWIGLTGDDSYFPATNNRLEQPCRLIGGKPDSLYCDDAGSNYIPSPVYIGPHPPNYDPEDLTADLPQPSPGDLWYDSEHLELRVWYVTGTSYGGWVSATHPGMRPDLAKDPTPKEISLTGPAVAQELVESQRYVATVSWKILDEYAKYNVGHPTVRWDCSDPNHKLISKNPDDTIVTFKFSKVGNYSVTAYVDYFEDVENQQKPKTGTSDPIKTNVQYRPVDLPLTYVVRVVDSGANGPVYEIDGEVQPHLNLMRNRKYIFDQSHPSNNGYPMRFYGATEYDGDVLSDRIGDEYITGVVTIRKNVEFNVPADAPIRLRYGSPTQSPADDFPDRKEMGWWMYPFDRDGIINLP